MGGIDDGDTQWTTHRITPLAHSVNTNNLRGLNPRQGKRAKNERTLSLIVFCHFWLLSNCPIHRGLSTTTDKNDSPRITPRARGKRVFSSTDGTCNSRLSLSVERIVLSFLPSSTFLCPSCEVSRGGRQTCRRYCGKTFKRTPPQ